MKLVNSQRGTSFYETFSDLVFNTLVLFLLVVVALVVQFKHVSTKISASQETPEERLVSAAELMIHPNRFTGAADDTFISVALVPVNGVTHVVWVPATVDARWGLNRAPGRIDPVLDLCREFLSPEGLTLMPADAFVQLAPDVGKAFADATSWSWRSSLTAFRLMEARRVLGARLQSMTPEALRDYIGGVSLDDPAMDRPDPALAESRRAWTAWATNGTQDLYARHAETLEPLRRQIAAGGSGVTSARLRLVVLPEGRLQAGGAVLSKQAVRGMLRSIKPGRGFYVEIASEEAGAEPSAPPSWVFEEILGPTGFDGRLLKEAALDALPAASGGN